PVGTMRPTLFAISSLLLVACATTSPADERETSGPGGKADDGHTQEIARCPIEREAGAEEILAAIEGGGSCYVAAGIAEACAWGSSIDVQFVAAATEVCSSGFDA